MKHHYQILALLLAALSLGGPAAEQPAVTNAVAKAAKPAATNSVPVAAKPDVAVKPAATNAVSVVAKPKVEVAKPEAEVARPTTNSVPVAVKSAVTNASAKAEVEKVPETKKDGGEETASASTNSAPTAAEAPADPKFERYRTILDRMPFGPEPAGFDPDSGAVGGGALSSDEAAAEAMAAAAEAQAQQMLSGVRISALNVTPRGSVAVGFTDSSKQPVASYYMKVGETRDGWTIKAADAKEMTVTLERDGVEGTLKLGEGADPNAKGAKGGNRPGLMQRPTMAGGMMGGRPGFNMGGRPGFGGGRFGGAPGMGAPGTMAAQPNETAGDALARLRARRAQKDADAQAERARAAAAAEQARLEREKEAADREKAAQERQQQLEALKQVQEELRRQREEAEQQRQQQQLQQQQQQLQQQQQQQQNSGVPGDGSGA